MKATVLSCPECGASVKSDQTSCEHCGSSIIFSDDAGQLLSLDSICPGCGRKNGPEDKHCGGCGRSLVVPCPNTNCLRVNSVWRQFCKACGVSIIGHRVRLAQERHEKFGREIEEHSREVERIERSLAASKIREKVVKGIIAVIGLGIAFGLFSGDSPVLASIVGVITLAWAWLYESSEIGNLGSALRGHQEDLNRLLVKKEQNDQEIETLASIGAIVPSP